MIASCGSTRHAGVRCRGIVLKIEALLSASCVNSISARSRLTVYVGRDLRGCRTFYLFRVSVSSPGSGAAVKADAAAGGQRRHDIARDGAGEARADDEKAVDFDTITIIDKAANLAGNKIGRAHV